MSRLGRFDRRRYFPTVGKIFEVESRGREAVGGRQVPFEIYSEVQHAGKGCGNHPSASSTVKRAGVGSWDMD